MRRMRDTIVHRIHGCYSEIDLDLKHLLKRGALLVAANWQTVVIQFVAETTFQVLLAVPIIGAAILVAVLPWARPPPPLPGGPLQVLTTVPGTPLSRAAPLLAA